MADDPILSPELLRQLIRFEADTGKYFWLPRPIGMFNSERLWKSWNATFANNETVNTKTTNGYLCVRILGRLYTGHRIAWVVHYGEWPNHTIDHINGDRADNRIENLRDVPHQKNLRNARRRTDNTSGITGVHWNKERNKWQANICLDGKNKHLGLFETIEEATSARLGVASQNGFHENHGRHQSLKQNQL